MKYLLLIAGDPSVVADETNDAMHEAYMKFTQEIIDSGELLGGDALQGVDTATTVRVRDGKRATTDGPYAETKEVLGGYYLVDVKDLDRALALAAKIPGARNGCVEVRPIMELPA